jgi:hypothetical protein
MLLAHLALAVFFTAGCLVFAPEGSFSGGSPPSSPGTTTAVKVTHLLCLATSWGATVWAIFVGGLVMFM